MLDEIITATESGGASGAPEVNLDLFASNLPVASATPPLFRGQGTKIAELNNDPKAIHEALQVDWEPVKLPMFAQGTQGGMAATPMYALWKSGHGAEDGYIDCCTKAYKPHLFRELVSQLCDFANSVGLAIDHVGTADGGTRIWASAEAKMQMEVAKGDLVSLRLDMSTAHTVGTATRYTASAYELWCSNGATISKALGLSRHTHQTKLSARQERDERLLQGIHRAFQAQIERHAELYKLPASPEIRRLLFIHLFGTEEDWASVCDHLATQRSTERRIGADMIERLLQCEDRGIARTVWADIKPGKLLMEVTEATKRQPGQQTSKGTLAHVYNGITYWNSNVRGREGNAQRAVLSSIHGPFRASSDTAMEVLTTQYVPALQAVYGRRG